MYRRATAGTAIWAVFARAVALGTVLLPILLAACAGDDGGGGGVPGY